MLESLLGGNAPGLVGGWDGREWLRAELQRAVVVEAGEAMAFYETGTPEEGSSFDLRAFPNIATPFELPMFFEGESRGTVISAGGERRARRGLLTWPPRDIPVHDPEVARETLAGAVDLVAVAPFMDLAVGAPGEVSGPPVVWVVPVGAEGWAAPGPGGSIGMLTAFRRRGRLSEDERREAENVPFMASILVNELHMALFCLSCLNAVVRRGVLEPEWGYRSEVGALRNVWGPVPRRGRPLEGVRRRVGLLRDRGVASRVLEVGPLLKKLRSAGRAEDVGLGHALTACRKEFFGRAAAGRASG